MDENETQVPQLTTTKILELAEQMLNLTEQMDNLVNQMLNLAIPAERDGDDVDEGWTAEKFEGLVHEFLKKRYETQNRDGELYRLGAELKNFFEEQGWELTHEFTVKHIFFFSQGRRLFGINLFSSRLRLTFCSVSEEEARVIVPDYNFTSYPQYSQLVCQRGPSVENLRPFFQYVFMKHVNPLSEALDIVDALKQILEDYDYLEYDEATSKRINALRVKVTRLNADRDFSVTGHICRALEQVTGKRFFVPGVVNSQNRETEWTFFTLHEWT